MFLFKDKLMSDKIPNQLSFLALGVSASVQQRKGMNKRISRLMSCAQSSLAKTHRRACVRNLLPSLCSLIRLSAILRSSDYLSWRRG